ncbi:Subtilase family protein [Hathewaya proteolytica DSM 3090]|uniref:Subtilase family protein n=1 Tax=Hathewaya proteolytica DSM 3090 TaxID=1121331 RepID=A0A1M6T065_9CLOT|nr:S8 family peptidase [Hathewaya proteolytica]SHK50299.1 Subtilase family protein [Hathewaya proteolytica DSM 3090]
MENNTEINNAEANNKDIFNSEEYIHYVVQYDGVYKDQDKNYKEKSDVYVTIITDDYAIFSVKKDLVSTLADTYFIMQLAKRSLNDNGNFIITYVLPPQVYTLQEISAVEATNVNLLQINLPLQLEGDGVVVGIIDTGIDYLNEEFTDANGKTRIVGIWDQTIPSGDAKEFNVPFGTFYTREDIDRALELKRQGGNPYDIVPSKDEEGHGTNLAGIVGATGKNGVTKGIATKCEFLVVKLIRNLYYEKTFQLKVPAFGLMSILSAIELMKNYLVKKGKPVVVLLPLGSNSGNHRGKNLIDAYIQSITSNVGIAVVTGAGNQGLEDNHVSGLIKNEDDESVVEIIVSPEQKYLFLELWATLPNIFEVNIISPSGEETGYIPAALNIKRSYNFIFENTKVSIYYYLPEEYSGEELIKMYFTNIRPGIWRLKIKLVLGKLARYDVWLPQSGLKEEGTRFTPSNPYGTTTVPADSQYVITVAAYNQNNNNILSYSGIYFNDEFIGGIDFAAGGVDTLTTGVNNTLNVINGTSLSAAIGAGACVLLFEWGIVDGHYPYMYSQSLKTFLQRGTIRRKGDTYPNAQWGYGIIDFYRIFTNIGNIL